MIPAVWETSAKEMRPAPRLPFDGWKSIGHLRHLRAKITTLYNVYIGNVSITQLHKTFPDFTKIFQNAIMYNWFKFTGIKEYLRINV
jgi:hypothetical protein